MKPQPLHSLVAGGAALLMGMSFSLQAHENGGG